MTDEPAKKTPRKGPPRKATSATAIPPPDEPPDAPFDYDMPVHPAATGLRLMNAAEYAGLRADIEQHGLLQPLVVDDQGRLVDGRNRLRVCKELGIKPDVTVWSGDHPLAFVVGMNLTRRHFSTGQRAAYAVEWLPELEAEASERRRATLKQSRGTEVADVPPRSSDPKAGGKSRDRVAAIFGVSSRLIQDAKYVQQHDAELFEKIKRDEITVTAAKDTLIRQENREPKKEKKNGTVIPLPVRSATGDDDAGITDPIDTSGPKPRSNRVGARPPATIAGSDDETSVPASLVRSVWTDQIAASIPDTDQKLRVVGELTVTDVDGTTVLLTLPPPSTDIT